MQATQDFHQKVISNSPQGDSPHGYSWAWFWFSTTIIALVSTISIYYWKDYQNQVAQEVLVFDTNKDINQKEQQILKTLCKPLLWSIQTNMMKKDLKRINGFVHNIVQMNHFSNINIVDTEGKILVASNKNYENTSALALYASPLFVQDSIVVLQKTNKVWVVAAPIKNIERRIGTLFFDYSPNTSTSIK